jgi:hypothetical protein
MTTICVTPRRPRYETMTASDRDLYRCRRLRKGCPVAGDLIKKIAGTTKMMLGMSHVARGKTAWSADSISHRLEIGNESLELGTSRGHNVQGMSRFVGIAMVPIVVVSMVASFRRPREGE